MKKYILVIFLSISFITNINALSNSIKLYDNADIFSQSEEEDIKNKINDYIDKHNMDLVIVTTSINTYNSTESFMEHFYQDNDFGIMTIDLDYNKYEYISYGEMQRYLDDKRIDAVYDYVDEKYKSSNKNYYVLANSFIDRLDYYVELGVPASNKDTYISDNGIMHKKKTFPIFTVLLIDIIISTVIILILCHKSKMIKKSIEANNYIDYNNINITSRTDRFITTNTTRTRKYNDSNNSVGGTSISGNHSSGHGGRSL